MAYSLATAKRIAREIEALDIRNWEDPVATFEDMRTLRRHTAIPFSTHSSELKRAVDCGVPDALVVNIAVLGGIARTIRFIGACEAIDVDFWFYSPESGVAARGRDACNGSHAIRTRAESVFIPLAGDRRD